MTVAAGRRQARSTEKRLELIRPALEDVVTQANQLALPKDVILEEFKKLLEEENE